MRSICRSHIVYIGHIYVTCESTNCMHIYNLYSIYVPLWSKYKCNHSRHVVTACKSSRCHTVEFTFIMMIVSSEHMPVCIKHRTCTLSEDSISCSILCPFSRCNN